MFWKYDEKKLLEVKDLVSVAFGEVPGVVGFGINVNAGSVCVYFSNEQTRAEASLPNMFHGVLLDKHISVSLNEINKQTSETEDDFQSSDETGAEQRFEARLDVFKEDNKPVYKHHGWWFIHNCVAHPLIGLLPCKKTFDFHDWTSKKINGK